MVLAFDDDSYDPSRREVASGDSPGRRVPMIDHIPRDAQRAALLAEMPPEDLTAFDAYYQGRLQQAQTEANAAHAGQLEPDPDLVEETLIAALIREADGRDHPEGLGFVPSEEGSYEIVPPEDDPRRVARRRPAVAAAAAPRLGR
jgi:hypothetical protein